MYLATVIDLYSRRLLGAATGLHPDAELACAAIKMAVTARGGKLAIWTDEHENKIIFHSDRGSTYDLPFQAVCPATSSPIPARPSAVVLDWCYGFYNHRDQFHQSVQGSGDPAVDGPGRVLLRQ